MGASMARRRQRAMKKKKALAKAAEQEKGVKPAITKEETPAAAKAADPSKKGKKAK